MVVISVSTANTVILGLSTPPSVFSEPLDRSEASRCDMPVAARLFFATRGQVRLRRAPPITRARVEA